VQAGARHDRDEAVRDLRRQAPREPWVAARRPPPVHDVHVVGERAQDARDVGRVVLAVAVDRDEDLAARVLDAGGERRRLAVVARQPDDPEARLLGREGRQQRRAPVGAAVVDDDDLRRPVEAVEDLPQLLDEGDDVLLLVVDRDDDRYVGGGRGQNSVSATKRL
jgi:hypothetical protein